MSSRKQLQSVNGFQESRDPNRRTRRKTKDTYFFEFFLVFFVLSLGVACDICKVRVPKHVHPICFGSAILFPFVDFFFFIPGTGQTTVNHS